MSAGKKKFLHYLLPGILACIILFFSVTCIEPGHDEGDDFALYILESKAIINGSLYNLAETNAYCMEHSLVRPGPDLYPPGYSYLLAPVVWLRGIDFIALKWVNILLLACCAFLMFRLFSFPHFSPVLQGIIVLWSLFQVEIITFPNQLLSEIPFLFFSLLALLSFSLPSGKKNSLIIASFIFCAYLTRDAGIFLIPALAVYQFLSRGSGKPKPISDNAYPYILFGLFVLCYYFIFPPAGKYHWDKLVDGIAWQTVVGNAQYYSTALMELLFKYDATWLRLVIVILLIFGLLSTLKKTPHFTVFGGCLVLLTLIWPLPMGIRPLIPLVLFIVYLLICGILNISRRIKIPMRFTVIILSAVTCISVYRNARFISEYNNTVDTNRGYSDEMQQLYVWINNHTPESAIIGAEKPRAVLLFTGRRSITTGPNHFEKSSAEWLLIDKKNNWPEAVEKVFETENYIIYKKANGDL